MEIVPEGTRADKYEMDKHIISKEQNQAESSLQECVEDRSKRANIMWTSIRNAHKRSKDNKPINRGRAQWRTYAQVATPVSE